MAGRRRLLGFLVAVFFIQTWLVYSDPAGTETAPLSPLAAQGQDIWLRHNCQSCHQIYGFGGFLGPDLTNASQRLTVARLDLMLTVGAGRMPSFQLPPSDRRAVLQFLTELDRTGVSQPRLAPARPPDELLDLLVERGKPLTEAETAGLQIVREQKCIACHLPNYDSPVRAPDLTTALDRLGRGKILATLEAGVPGKVMPRFTFTANQQDAVIAFLGWLHDHREQAEKIFEVTRPGGGSIWSIPWFEYE